MGVYYEWGCDAKVTYPKFSTDKNVKKLVEGYGKYTASDIQVQETSGAPGTTLSKSTLKGTYNIDTYI